MNGSCGLNRKFLRSSELADGLRRPRASRLGPAIGPTQMLDLPFSRIPSAANGSSSWPPLGCRQMCWTTCIGIGYLDQGCHMNPSRILDRCVLDDLLDGSLDAKLDRPPH